MHIQRDRLPDNETIVNSMGRSTDEAAVTAAIEPQQDQPDLFDDVFGTADSPIHGSPSAGTSTTANDQQHPSDVGRLRAEHSTAGYRDGITAAKATSIQAGFDEGFSLGAALGLRAGQITGILEGVVAALRTRRDPQLAETAALLARCRVALRPQSIFGPEFWNPDGTWKYEVGHGSAKGGDDVVFSDVVDAHPLIRTWSDILKVEMARWGIDESIVDRESGSGGETAATTDVQGAGQGSSGQGPSTLEW